MNEKFSDPWESVANRMDFQAIVWDTFMKDGDPFTDEEGATFRTFWDFVKHTTHEGTGTS